MRRPGEVALLLALFVLLGTLHGTSAQYDDYDDYNYGEDYDYSHLDYESDEDEEEMLVEPQLEPKEDSEYEEGRPPTANPQNQEFTPMCNNENCWIRVDWEPPPRDTWMSCLLGYRVGFRKTGSGPLIWMNDEGTHRDLRSDKLFFFEEAEGTNHSLTIRNLEHQTEYVVTIEVFNPYGSAEDFQIVFVDTPPGYLSISKKILIL